jgi:hypothetical protein
MGIAMGTLVILDFMGIEISVFGTFLCLLAHHPLGQEIGKGLAHVEIPKISQHAGIKAGIEEMKDGMLYPANILVHRHPVIHSLRIHGALIIIWTCIAVKIPGRLYKGVHRVRLSSGRALAFGT